MRVWFFENPVRFAAERRAVEDLASQEDWLRIERWRLVEFRMAVECVISAGAEYPVRLVFPDQFPEVPAWVEPQDPNAKWSHHQYGPGGALCLELRPDNWVSSANGADVLRSAYNLLKKENPLGAETEKGTVPSAHSIGEVQAYSWTQPVMIGAGLVERMRTGTAKNVRALQWSVVDDKLRTFVFDDVDRDSPRRPPPPGDVLSELPVYCAPSDAPANPPATRADLAASVGDDLAAKIVSCQHGLLLSAGSSELTAYHLIGSGPGYQRRVSVLAEDAGVRSARSDAAAGKRVAVVGAGSIGSKVAECLVRSGVTKLRIVDGDVMLPGNLERHVLDWRDIGVLKVDGVKRRALLITPGADIEAIDNNLNWQRSARTHAWQVDAISDCDVVLDATGDVPTSLFLGAIAAANKKVFVSTVVFEGGLGALVATCVPDRDPPYAAARAAFLGWCDEQAVAVPESTGRRYEAIGADGVPIAADDAAVTMAAGHTARVILDCIDGTPPERGSAWLLIGFRAGWVFKGHGDVIRLSVGEPTETAGSTRDDEALAFAITLTKEALDARANRE